MIAYMGDGTLRHVSGHLGCPDLYYYDGWRMSAAKITSGSSSPVAEQESLTRIREPSKFRATLWGIVLVSVGIVLEVLALVGWGKGRWADVYVSVGARAMLAGFVMFLEPRLVRDVGRATSKATADLVARKVTEAAAHEVETRTREFDERLSRVESLRDVQDRVRRERDREATRLADRLRGVPDYQDVFDLLSDADSRGLFARLWLRCGPDQSLLLNFKRAELTRGDGVYLGWRIFVTLAKTTVRPVLPAGVLERPDVFMELVVNSEWRPNESFEDAYRRFDEAWERANRSRGSIDFDSAISSLIKSYETAVDSRSSDGDDSVRLIGRLTLLANDQWAITAEGSGLGVPGPVFERHRLEGLLGGFAYDRWPLAAEDGTRVISCPEGYDPSLWEDALFYAERFLPHHSG